MRRRGAVILGAAFALGYVPGASAAEAPRGIAAAFGNTLKATYPDGRFQRYWFGKDGTWRAIGRRGKPSSGKWMLKGEQVCLRQSKPFPSPTRFCTDFPSNGALGSSWQAKDVSGKPVKLSLLAGGR